MYVCVYIYTQTYTYIRGPGSAKVTGDIFKKTVLQKYVQELKMCSGKPVADHMGDHGLVANELLIPMKNPNLYLE